MSFSILSQESKTTIYFGADHGGFELKEYLKSELAKHYPKLSVKDLGASSMASVDYPDYAKEVSIEVSKSRFSFGILVCGSGIGMSIAANKFSGIRAALVENPVSARLSREHNNANILCLGGRFTAPPYAFEILRSWLAAEFTSDPRHEKRLEKIRTIEKA